MRLRTNFYIQLLVGVTLFFGGAPSWAQTAQPGSPTENPEINVTADKLSSGDGGNQIEATGSVEVKRQQTTLKADDVRVNRETQDIDAKGHVSVDDPQYKIKSADALKFNMEKETGEIQNGDLFIEQGHLSMTGGRIEKFAGQTYHVDEAFFTTCLCDSGKPSWTISADKLDLNRDGMGIIQKGYFYILDIPVFYLPYGLFPLNTDRQTGLLFPNIGSSSKEGFRFQQPFFWAISKSTDATVTFNVESRARVGFLGEFRTMFDRNSDFQLRASYFNESLGGQRIDEQDIDQTIADPNVPINRWNIIGTHRYTSVSDWLTYSDIAAYSDDLFARQLIERFDLPGTKEFDIRRSRFGESRFGLFKNWDDTFFKGEWNFYQDFIQNDKGTLQRTPQISFWGRRFFQKNPLELRWRAEGVNYLRRDGGDGLRLDLRPEVALPFQMSNYLFGSLNLAPRETVYHLYEAEASSDHNLSREVIELRGNVATSIGRIFDWGGEALQKIKHEIEPELSYLFIPHTQQQHIPVMDGVDRINRRNVLTFGLTNRFWGKFAQRTFATPSETDTDKDVELLNPLTSGDVRE